MRMRVNLLKLLPVQLTFRLAFRLASYGKIALMSNTSKTVTDTMMESMETEHKIDPGLSIGTMTFDLGRL